MNIGENCFSACNQESGPCEFCGFKGVCCKVGEDEENCGNAGCMDEYCCTYADKISKLMQLIQNISLKLNLEEFK